MLIQSRTSGHSFRFSTAHPTPANTLSQLVPLEKRGGARLWRRAPVWKYGSDHELELDSDQDVHQRGVAFYLLDWLELSPQWSVMAGLRHDSIYNKLDDNLATTALDLSGSRSFSKTTARIGLAWNPTPSFGAYASWGQGFLPPATEELSHNPDRFG